MKALKHLSEQPFVVIVGIAALIHSTWTVATFSGGTGPNVDSILSCLSWLWWILPGFLTAFALEVGQVVTARQIQRGIGRKLKLGKFRFNVKTLTFVVLSAATYLLQLTYLLHHYPDVALGTGLSASSRQASVTVNEIIIWGMPILLPLSMLLFTAGDEASPEDHQRRIAALTPASITCPDCDWSGSYSDSIAAQNALNGHMRKHNLLVTTSNGRH